MKRATLFLSIFLMIFAVTSNKLSASDKHLQKFEKSGLPVPTDPKIHEIKLTNGIVAFFVEDHTLPYFKLSATLKAGSIYDPVTKLGLASITSATMRSGGAGELSPEQLDKEIDALGADISISSSRELTTAATQSLVGDADKVMKLFADVVLRPRFEEARIKVAKNKLLESILREKDDPPAYSSRLFLQMVYGDDSPWARIPNANTIANISRDDLLEFRSNYYKPSNMIFSGAGDLSANEFKALLEKYFAEIPAAEVSFPEVKGVDYVFSPAEKKVSGPKAQSFVRIGHLGVKRHNKDWHSLQVLSTILGGGSFKSRLLSDLRTQRGLVYNIGGGFSQGTDYGLFQVRLSTSTAKETEAVDLVKKHIEVLSRGGEITDEEFVFAKKNLLSTAIFDMEIPFDVASARTGFYIYGYPANYWTVNYKKLQAVSKEDVSAVAKKYVHPDGLKLLIYGGE